MKLGYDTKSKDPTYYIQQGIRNGKKTTTKNIVRIGKHSELLAVTDDPLAYAKEQVAKYNEEYKNRNKVTMDLSIDFAEKILASNHPVSDSTVSNVGYFYLQQIYHDLAIRQWFRDITSGRKFQFDPDQVNRFLTCARILWPESKLATVRHLGRFYENPGIDHQHILRCMDLMEDHFEEYITFLFEHSNNIVKRRTSVCYYDCTNFYFEIESPDYDYVDEVTGEMIRGFRKYGVSKEHRPNPIVEMGLFMDADGIPLSMCLTSGSDNEQTTAIPMEKQLVKMLKGKTFIYCADAGLSSYNIRNFNSMGGRAFIVTQSLKKLSNVLKNAVFNDYEYSLLSDDSPVSIEHMKTFDHKDEKNKALYSDKAFKIIPANNRVDLGLYEEKTFHNGKTAQVKVKGTMKQSLIVTFSRKAMEYQRWIRGRQVERAKKMLGSLDPETYKKGPNDVTRFIKRQAKTKDSKNMYVLDEEKIAEEEKYDGYYAIATNLDCKKIEDVREILRVCADRSKIEDCFRIMKSNFDGRPVYHRLPERITAHFMICYTALLIYRLLETKLEKEQFHLSIDNVIETLQNMEVANVQDMFYMATYKGSQVLTALNALYPELGLDKKYYLPKDLNKKIKKISK